MKNYLLPLLSLTFFSCLAQDPLRIILQSINPTIQCDDPGGPARISITLRGGTLPYFYTINNGDQLQSDNQTIEIETNEPGSKVVRITDSSASPETIQTSFTVGPAQFNLVATFFERSCTGTEGRVNLRVEGTPFPRPVTARFTLNGREQIATGSASFENVPTGDLAITVTELDPPPECPSEITFNTPFILPTAIEFTTETQNDNGQGTGVIAITAITGGAPPFLYNLNNGPSQETPVFTRLDAGIYEVFVVESQGPCFATKEVEVELSTGNTIADFIAEKYCSA